MSTEELSEHTLLSIDALHIHLDALAGLNLLNARVTDEVRYRFETADPDIMLIVHELDDAYRTRRAEVMALLAEAGYGPMRRFADAFRLRRGDR